MNKDTCLRDSYATRMLSGKANLLRLLYLVTMDLSYARLSLLAPIFYQLKFCFSLRAQFWSHPLSKTFPDNASSYNLFSSLWQN